jgi:hypothetical protein
VSIADEEERKDDVRERVRRLGGYPAALYAADKLSKVRELPLLMASGAPREEVEAKPRPAQERSTAALIDCPKASAPPRADRSASGAISFPIPCPSSTL